MKIISIPIKRKWFDMIVSGEKKEEYRAIVPHWINRFTWHEWHKLNPETLMPMMKIYPEDVFRKDIDGIRAHNGYQIDSPVIIWAHNGIRVGYPNPKWCDPQDISKKVFILSIGDLLKIQK